jgi:hypothetical protein
MNITINISKLKLIVFVFVVLTVFSSTNTISAQKATSSPYSRYGIGDVTGKGFGQNFAMGGTTIAVQNDTTPYFYINTGNPASYSNVRLTTAELGVNYNRVELQNSTSKKIINNVSFAYLSLAFPFKKWWGGSFGLLPFSSVGYQVSDHQSITNIGNVDFLYDGSGGVNQVYFGNGIKPLYGLPRMFTRSKKYSRLLLENNKAEITHILKRKKSWQNLSVGANVSYLFGSMQNSRRSIFAFNSNAFNTRAVTTSRISDMYFDYGAQYSYTFDSLKGRDLKDNVKLLLGATFAAQTDVSAKIDSISYSYFTNSAGYEIVKDSIETTKNTKGKITFPLSFGFGIGLKKGDRWLVAADFAMQNWSSFQTFNQSQGLKNSMRVSVGTQFVPNSKSSGLDNYYKRINYRIGARYAQTALELKGTQLTEQAVSIGLGFPVGRNYLLQNFSMVNIGVEVGHRGTTNNGLIKENFFKATVGFTINDRWFVKPKID